MCLTGLRLSRRTGVSAGSSAGRCEGGYRWSVLGKGRVVTSVELALRAEDPETLRARVRQAREQRRGAIAAGAVGRQRVPQPGRGLRRQAAGARRLQGAAPRGCRGQRAPRQRDRQPGRRDGRGRARAGGGRWRHGCASGSASASSSSSRSWTRRARCSPIRKRRLHESPRVVEIRPLSTTEIAKEITA